MVTPSLSRRQALPLPRSLPIAPVTPCGCSGVCAPEYLVGPPEADARMDLGLLERKASGREGKKQARAEAAMEKARWGTAWPWLSRGPGLTQEEHGPSLELRRTWEMWGPQAASQTGSCQAGGGPLREGGRAAHLGARLLA